MNKDEKAAVVAELAAQIKESEAIFAIDYRGMSVPEIAGLRDKLREADATFRVAKNSLSERAADEAGLEVLRPLLQGPTALTFVRGDAATAAKALADTAKTTEHLAFKGGVLNGEALTEDQVKAISKLPSREQLYAQLVGLVASPITGLARSLNGLIGGLAVQLGQIRDQGLVTGEAPAPAAEAPAEAEAAETPEAEAPTEGEAETPAEPEAEAPAAEEAPEAEAPAAEEAPEAEAATEPETESNGEEPSAEAEATEADESEEG